MPIVGARPRARLPEVLNVRRFAVAAVLAVCLGAPIVEVFDRWDQTLQRATDSEANIIVVALCVGIALSVAGIVASRIRAMSSQTGSRIIAIATVRFATCAFVVPIPPASPPTSLRV